MKTLTRFTILSFAVGFYIGCSPVKFSLDESKCQDVGGTCVVENGQYSIGPETIVVGGGKVDILIVNDNSASMSFEQKRLAPRFQNFISELDSRHVDYRIAMTTTDVSGAGAYTNGQLIAFDSNTFYLTPQMSNRQSLFNASIQRNETKNCENFMANWLRDHNNNMNSLDTAEYSQKYAQNCPSGDERGIYAANLVIKNNPNAFMRPDAHLAVIFLSDEDERSGLYNTNGYRLEQMDQPAYLVQNVKETLGTDKYNSLSVHSIVVKDSSCLDEQNKQILGEPANPATQGLVRGSIGTVYMTFATQGWGRSANICSTDYTSELGRIRTSISDKIKEVMLKCTNPSDLVVTISGASPGYYVEGKVLKFSQELPVGTSVTLSYKCDSL